MLYAPNSINELAPGERINPELMCQLLCLNDNGIGCVCTGYAEHAEQHNFQHNACFFNTGISVETQDCVVGFAILANRIPASNFSLLCKSHSPTLSILRSRMV